MVKDRLIAGNFHKEGGKYIKGRDQDFLGQQVWPIISSVSIVHDAYLCKSFGGQPFPTKRQGNCYIGNAGPCDPINGVFEHKCPPECRNPNGKDWEFC